MVAPLLIRKYAILAKVESSYGVDAVPTASNAILVENVKISPMFEKISRANVASPDLDKLPSLIGKFAWKISFDCELRGSGVSAITPPDYGALLRGCSMDEDVGVANVVYHPISTAAESLTIRCYLDGIRHQMVGCVGDWKMTGEVGKPAKFSLEFQGKMDAMPDDSAAPTITFQNTNPPLCLGATWDYGGWSACLSKFNFALNNAIAPRECIQEAYGYNGFFVSDRNPEGGWDPEVQPMATKDAWADLVDRNVAALAVSMGTAAGNTVAVDAPKCYISNLGYADRNGILTYEKSFEMSRNLGDDSFTITTS